MGRKPKEKTTAPYPIGTMIEKFKPLIAEKWRYKIYYGSRGGAKTYSFATAAILKCLQGKQKILCCREIMDSISDSVYATIVLRISEMNLSEYFTITKSEIVCNTTKSSFIFAGLFRNIEKIKSIPGITICWINEANTVSEESLQLLFPTIREEGSEIWIEFNPQYEDDPVYKRFIVQKPPEALVVNVNWWDNPFISQTLLKEKDNDYAYRPKEAKHIWEGQLTGYGNLVWKPPFEDGVHVHHFDFEQIRSKANIYMACDPHAHYYCACIWIAVWPKADGKTFYKWVFAEWPRWSHFKEYYSEIRSKIKYTGTLADMSREFLALENEMQVKVAHRYMDTRFAKGAGSAAVWSGQTMGIVQEWSKPENGGLLFELPPEKIIDAQKDAIKRDLQYNSLAPLTPVLNEPCLYIDPGCRNLIYSLRNHKTEEDSEREAEKHKDFSDALRIGWAGMACSPWRDPAPKQAATTGYSYSGGGGDVGWMG